MPHTLVSAEAGLNCRITNVNDYWKCYLKETLDIESSPELGIDTHYIRFLMPTISNSDEGNKKRYAGLVND